MKAIIATSLKSNLPQTKGLTLMETKHLKTQTNVTITIDHKTRAKVNFVNAINKEVSLIKGQGAELAEVKLSVTDAPSLGKLLNRSMLAFADIGIEVDHKADFEASTAEATFTCKGCYGSDLGIVVDLLSRLATRANKKMSGTEHPLTLFDLRQTIGLVYDAKQQVPGADQVEDFITVRADEYKPKPAPKPKPEGTRKAKTPKATSKAKGKAKGKAKAKNQSSPAKAQLSDLG